MITSNYVRGSEDDHILDVQQDSILGDQQDHKYSIATGIELSSTKGQSKKTQRRFSIKDTVDSGVKIMAEMMKEVKPEGSSPKVNKTTALLASENAITQTIKAGYSAKQVADWWTEKGPFPVSAKLITQLFISKPKSIIKKTRNRKEAARPPVDVARASFNYEKPTSTENVDGEVQTSQDKINSVEPMYPPSPKVVLSSLLKMTGYTIDDEHDD